MLAPCPQSWERGSFCLQVLWYDESTRGKIFDYLGTQLLSRHDSSQCQLVTFVQTSHQQLSCQSAQIIPCCLLYRNISNRFVRCSLGAKIFQAFFGEVVISCNDLEICRLFARHLNETLTVGFKEKSSQSVRGERVKMVGRRLVEYFPELYRGQGTCQPLTTGSCLQTGDHIDQLLFQTSTDRKYYEHFLGFLPRSQAQCLKSSWSYKGNLPAKICERQDDGWKVS